MNLDRLSSSPDLENNLASYIKEFMLCTIISRHVVDVKFKSEYLASGLAPQTHPFVKTANQ